MLWTKKIMMGLALFGFGAAVTPRLAEALPTHEVEYVYYSDATMTNEVGEKLAVSCNGDGNKMLWGRTSPYALKTSTSCSTGKQTGGCYSHGSPISCPASICDSVPEFCD